MESSPLTGRDAVEALSLAARLGNSNARFDRRALSASLRTRAGRLRIMAGFALRVAVPRFHVMRAHTAEGSGKAPRRVTRGARGTPARARPEPSGAESGGRTAPNAFVWASGVFDASGTITTNARRLRLALNTTDREIARRFQDAVGVGKVYGPYANNSRDGSLRQPFFIWLVEGALAQDLAERLRPHLGSARAMRLDEITAEVA